MNYDYDHDTITTIIRAARIWVGCTCMGMEGTDVFARPLVTTSIEIAG